MASDNSGAKNAKYAYQDWPSLNVFWCGGRGLSGPDRGQWWLAVVMLYPPFGVWLGTLGPWQWEHQSPAVPLLACWIVVAATVFFVLASFMDPGILPRQPAPPERQEPPKHIVRVAGPRGAELKLKWCTTCFLFRPPRASHCPECDNCVEGFDHHCPWLGNCVGRRNYKVFMYFVTLVFTLTIYIFAFSLAELVTHATRGETSNWRFIVSVCFAIYALIAGAIVSSLAFYHAFLVSTGQSTYEQLKKHYKSEKNPWDRGVVQNWVRAAWRQWHPKYIQPRAPYAPRQKESESFTGLLHSIVAQQINADGKRVLPAPPPDNSPESLSSPSPPPSPQSTTTTTLTTPAATTTSGATATPPADAAKIDLVEQPDDNNNDNNNAATPANAAAAADDHDDDAERRRAKKEKKERRRAERDAAAAAAAAAPTAAATPTTSTPTPTTPTTTTAAATATATTTPTDATEAGAADADADADAERRRAKKEKKERRQQERAAAADKAAEAERAAAASDGGEAATTSSD